MASFNIVALVVIILVIIVLIAIVCVAIRRKDRDSRSQSSESQSTQSNSSSSSGSRWETRAPNQNDHPSDNYVVMTGKPSQPQQAAQAPQQRVPVNAAFPRHAAKAGKKDFSAQIQNSIQQQQQHIAVETGKEETIYVESMADLYSPKQDLMAELGVDKETLDKMVQSYKKNHEYKERKLPVSRYFNVESYNDSKAVLRESAINLGRNVGSKRGKITGSIYKKYGKNVTKAHVTFPGEVSSLIPNSEAHALEIQKSQGRRNQGTLVVSQ